MNFVEYISNSTGYSPATVSNVMDSFWKFVQFSLRSGQAVKIEKFGKFGSKDVEGRKGRNPRTGEEILIPSKRKAIFKFSKGFVELIQPDAAAFPPFGNHLDEEVAIVEPTPEPEEANCLQQRFAIAPPPPPPPTLPTPKSAPEGEAATKRKTRSRKKEETPPPVPQELLLSGTGRSWYVAGIDKSIAESQLISQGVKPETPLWNKDSGWKLARDIPQLNYLFGS